MVLEFVGKIFDFIVGGPPHAHDSDPRPSQDEQVELEVDHSLDEPTTESVDNLNLDATPMDNALFQAPKGICHTGKGQDKTELFQWILILLRLVTTVHFGFPAWKPEPDEADSVSRFHMQIYGYLNAITTLLLRRDEIVAAVESSPGSGIIMSDDKSTNPEVRWHLYLYHLTQIVRVSVRRFGVGGSRIL
jgi:hypothetical protein